MEGNYIGRLNERLYNAQYLKKTYAVIYFCIGLPPNNSPRSSGFTPLAHSLLMILKRSSTYAFYTGNRISRQVIRPKLCQYLGCLGLFQLYRIRI